MTGLQRERPRRAARGVKSAVSIGIVLAAAAAAVLLAVFDDDDRDGSRSAPPVELSARVAHTPALFYGRELALAGEVTDVLGPRTFAIGGEGFLPDDRLLVVARRPVAAPGGRPEARPILERDIVQVEGTVRVMDVARLERELGVDLPARVNAADGDPVLVADAVDVTPRLLAIGGRAPAAAIARAPGRYVGRLVSVEGRVTDVLRDGVVVLDGRVPVLLAGDRGPTLESGDTVRVRGAVRRLDLDAFRREGLGDFDDRLFGDFARAPVIVAADWTVSGG